jgi:hypothetical protein
MRGVGVPGTGRDCCLSSMSPCRVLEKGCDDCGGSAGDEVALLASGASVVEEVRGVVAGRE